MSADFAPSVDGRLPAALAITSTPVDETISPNDAMAVAHVAGYLAVGESALKAIRLGLIGARAQPPARILDFACGHGRVLRWLRAAFPDAQLTGTDIDTDGVDFCARTFNAKGVYSTTSPGTELFDDRYDLIWVGSLFTHLDRDRWADFLDLMHELLDVGGVLVMTTHGALVAERMRCGAHYGYPREDVAAAVIDYETSGFGFARDGSPSGYGISVSSVPWVATEVLRHRDMQMVACTEALWANHQDVVAVLRSPIDPNAADRPYT